MTNTLALWLVALIAGFLALDAYVLRWDVPVLAMRALTDLIRWLAVWR